MFNKYILAFFIFCTCLFIAPHAYSFFHFDVIDPTEMYMQDKRQWDKTHFMEDQFVSYPCWLAEQDKKHSDAFNSFAEGIALSFDPWFEPNVASNDSPAMQNIEHGRD